MRRLALFARVPEIGKVKTRLSPALPPAAACELYRGMLEDALAAVRGSRLADERFVYWAGTPSAPGAGGIVERRQAGGDLGDRLAAAFEELLAAPADRAVIIGSDCPALDSRVIDEAFGRLDSAPLVVAPARDGGYALIGLALREPALFRGIGWSTNRVLEQTLARAGEAGLEGSSLEAFDDVDTAEDVCALVARAVMPGATIGKHADAALEALGFLPPAR